MPEKEWNPEPGITGQDTGGGHEAVQAVGKGTRLLSAAGAGGQQPVLNVGVGKPAGPAARLLCLRDRGRQKNERQR